MLFLLSLLLLTLLHFAGVDIHRFWIAKKFVCFRNKESEKRKKYDCSILIGFTTGRASDTTAVIYHTLQAGGMIYTSRYLCHIAHPSDDCRFA